LGAQQRLRFRGYDHSSGQEASGDGGGITARTKVLVECLRSFRCCCGKGYSKIGSKPEQALAGESAMRTISLLVSMSVALLSSATLAQLPGPGTAGDKIGSPPPLPGPPALTDPSATTKPADAVRNGDQPSTKGISRIRCTFQHAACALLHRATAVAECRSRPECGWPGWFDQIGSRRFLQFVRPRDRWIYDLCWDS
jgi:hypothetical protein